MTGQEVALSPELVAQVRTELVRLRGARGKLSPQKLGQFPTLVRVLGDGDLLDAFMVLRRELRRYIQTANRDEAAAAMSIYAEADSVLDRLEYTAARLSDDEMRDQRTARRWSDAGMHAIAQDIVYMSTIQGRLGSELLSIELHESTGGGLLVVIDQIVQTNLDVSAPELSLWAMNAQGDPEELKVDLGDYPATVVARDDYRMISQRVVLVAELLERITIQQGLTLTVTGRDAPMRTVSFVNRWLVPQFNVAMSAYRTRAAVEITRAE